MKKLIRNIALLLLPIVLYYGVFLAFEPNNYFGLRAETPSGAVFGAMREYRKNPTSSVIVGDSRLAHFDMKLVEETAGRPFGNLAFGGASLKEAGDMLEWVLRENPAINEVVFGLSFYTLNAAYNLDRFGTIEKSLRNPLAYLTSLSYNFLTLDRLRVWLGGGDLGAGESETEDPASYEYAPYTDPISGETVMLRTRIIRYMADIHRYTSAWQPNEAEFERLLGLITEYTGRGIRFVVVMPPVDDAILKYEVAANGILDAMLPMQRRLAESGALVLDYELANRPALREDQFFDGFHLDYVRGLPQWTEMLFRDINAENL